MRIWNKFFGKKPAKKSEKSPYFPSIEDPVDLSFVKNFTANGGLFLYNESLALVQSNFMQICIENNWKKNEIVSLDKAISQHFGTHYIDQKSGKLSHFKAVLIHCEYLIGNTGKILLSKHQINHFKVKDLPQTIIVSAKINQLTRDVSQGMTLLKNKYLKDIPTNITTLNIESARSSDIKDQSSQTSTKNIYLLLEDF